MIQSPSPHGTSTSTTQTYNAFLQSYHPVCKNRRHFQTPIQGREKLYHTSNWHTSLLWPRSGIHHAHSPQLTCINTSQIHQRNNDQDTIFLTMWPPITTQSSPTKQATWYSMCTATLHTSASQKNKVKQEAIFFHVIQHQGHRKQWSCSQHFPAYQICNVFCGRSHT